MFSCEFCKIYQNRFFIERLETAGNILKSQGLYRSFLNGNVTQFISKPFFQTFTNLFFLKRAVLGLENYHKFSRFSLCGQLH